MQKIVQQEREEHMNLSVKEREASEKIKELQNDAIKIEGLTKDLSGDLYNKCVENTKLQEEVSVLKEKKMMNWPRLFIVRKISMKLTVKKSKNSEKLVMPD